MKFLPPSREAGLPFCLSWNDDLLAQMGEGEVALGI